MTQETEVKVTQVARLDKTQPPPGYTLTPSCGVWVADEGGTLIREDESFDGEASAIAAAWAHYEREHDPPGLSEIFECAIGWDDTGGIKRGIKFRFGIVSDEVGYSTREAARFAAWAWYWRRVALANDIDAHLECPYCDNTDPVVEHFDDGTCSQPWCVECDSEMGGIGGQWPECLAWPDEQASAVERWLAEGGQWPEVLDA